MNIGAVDAIDDQKFLSDCFVNTGDLSVLRDTDDNKCIVLGRTGAGKTALLSTIKSKEEHVIDLELDELSLNFISNSTILTFLEELNVNLDLFYQLLWKHVLTVELIKYKYNIINESKNKSFFDSLSSIFSRDKRKEQAINYLSQWGDKFWLETDYRVREITSRLEKEILASIGLDKLGINLEAQDLSKLSEEQKIEVSTRAQSIVNRVQIQDLSQVINLLAQDIFVDPQQKYYILIDKLDDNWVDEGIRYKLIRALIESIKTFRRIKPVKIILALRLDLLERVFDKTRDAGFQEEKYEDLIIRLRWNKQQLQEIIDKRIGALIREHYTKKSATFIDIFPAHVGNSSSLNFILDRTLLRPRDAIVFINECLKKAEGTTQITPTQMRSAEITYSRKRLQSLTHEWFVDYPLLMTYCDLLKKRTSSFKRSAITRQEVDDIALDLSILDKHPNDPIHKIAKQYTESSISWANLLNSLIKNLYKVGVIGIKKDSYESPIWSQLDEPVISDGEVKRSSTIYVHPMLWRVLGINDDSRAQKKNI